MVKLQVYVDEETAALIDAHRGLGTRSAFAKAAIQAYLGTAPPDTPQAAPPKEKRRMPALRGTGGASR